LVYFEEFTDINQAILREKQLKNWHHDWKIELIKKSNPTIDTLQI
jgi:putative endonuclease